MKREYLDYLQDIVEAMRDIQTFVQGLTYDTFEEDRKTVNAVVRSLEVIGEAVKNLPDDVKERFPDMPWRQLAGMRDKLIHEYFGVETSIVWKVATEELPPLLNSLEKIFKELDGDA